MDRLVYQLTVLTIYLAPCFLLIWLFNRLTGIRHEAGAVRTVVHHLPMFFFGLLAAQPLGLGRLVIMLLGFAVLGVIADRLARIDHKENVWRTAVHHMPIFLLGMALRHAVARF